MEFSPPFLEMRGESEGDQGERVVRVLTTILERAGDEVELPPRHSLLPVW